MKATFKSATKDCLSCFKKNEYQTLVLAFSILVYKIRIFIMFDLVQHRANTIVQPVRHVI